MIGLAAAAVVALAAVPAREAAPGIGQIEVHAPAGPPEQVVLLVSAAGEEPADGVRALAAELAERGALTVTLDVRAWIAEQPPRRCAYPAGQLEELAQRIEKLRGLDRYLRPALVGVGAGATLVWAALAQGPAGTFQGAVAIAPCPDRPLPVRLCAPHGPPPRRLATGDLPALAPLPAPLEVIAAGNAPACSAADAERLARALSARLTSVPEAAASPAAIAPAVRAALARIAPPLPPVTAAHAEGVSVRDLPLVEVPSPRAGRRLAVLLTGDGGWVGIDKALASAFADGGVAVVALDSLRYFWKRRTPEETARDVDRVLAHYRSAWGRDQVLLVGYSRGADIVPIIAGRLRPEERARLVLVAMLGPGTFAELEVHAVDLLLSRRRAGALPTEDAVRALGGAAPILCVQGADERDSLCPHVRDLPAVKTVVLPGGHHFGGSYRELAARVLEAAAPER